LTTSNNHCSIVFTSEVVKIVTFETETWLKFRDETETDTSSKTPRPRLETWSSRPRPRLKTSKFVHFAEIFHKNVVIISDRGRPQGGNGHFPPWDWNEAPRLSRKHEVSSSIPINWLNFWNATVFFGMTLTLHNSQVHCSGIMQWWACNSLVFTPLRGQTWERIFSGAGVYCVTISWQQIFEG